jgi:tetratricopeptide (TPR) repeat protein
MNAAASVAAYLENFLWPFNLWVVYPLPQSEPIATAVFGIIVLFTFTALAFSQMRRRPWLFVGWFWFLGMLVPVLGFVQVGLQAMADRYTYLPILGVQLSLLWTLRELISLPRTQRIAMATAALLLAGCAARTWNQIQFWQNSKTLYEHALMVTKDNYLAESNLGTTFFNKGNFTAAELHFRRAIKLKPDFATAQFKLAVTLEELNRSDDALAVYNAFLRLRPRDELANYNAGVLLLNQNQFAQAAAKFQTALESNSDYTAALVGLAMARMKLNETADAIDALQRGLRLDPDFPGAAETLAQLKRNQDSPAKISTSSISKISVEPAGIPETDSSP